MMKGGVRFSQIGIMACVLSGLVLARGSARAGEINSVELRWNQVGYRPEGIKVGLAFAGTNTMPGWFGIHDAATKRKVFEGAVRPISAAWGKIGPVVELDFSALKTEGVYSIRFGSAESRPFAIEENLYANLGDSLLGFMRQQRCGYNPWLKAACHVEDGLTVEGPMADGTKLDAAGGWHDAADLLKYLLTSGNAAAELLLAYRLNPRLFGDRVLASGDPGRNGVPDVLDEARWGLEWMLKLHPAPDQLFHQVADDRDHCGWRLPQNERADYGWGPGKERPVYFSTGHPQGLNQYKSQSSGVANLAGRYAAAMALAYRTFGKIPGQEEFAARCLQAGKEVYALGLKQPGVQQGNSYGAPYRYEETTWADDMEWGAAELHRVTGEPGYLGEAQRWAEAIGSVSWMGKEQTAHYEFYPFINVGHFALHSVADLEVRKQLEKFYREGLELCRNRSETNPFRAGVPFIWCSNNLMAALAAQAAFYKQMSGSSEFERLGAAQVDWLLGRNPWGYSMFTSFPDDGLAPRRPHLMTSKLTGREIGGGLVDGPVYERIFRTLKGVSLSQEDLWGQFHGEAVYHDDWFDYATNEPTMDGTATAILMVGALSAE